MDLFNTNLIQNILPVDGIANYHGYVLNQAAAKHYLDTLLNTIAWKNDELMIYGKHIITKRMAAWYGDNNYAYTYSNTTKQALPWTPELLELKQLVEGINKTTYNSCLLNLYHNGTEGMGWHSDDEKSIGANTSIASVSLGAERKFAFKHKRSGQTVNLLLHNGSMLEMKGTTQTNWLHQLPKTTREPKPRINLTFRTMV